jgi:hypothetical protein
MSNIAAELRERLKLRYMGDCKCGHCALVPDELVARAAIEIEGLTLAQNALQNLMAQLITVQNGASANGNVFIRAQPIPASVYDAALAGAAHSAGKSDIDQQGR